ncbi:tRNA lysidine(34) synthetase TilS [Hyphomicrobium sp.]|uniref:tRNA lysidine(34) synthetase TilS n=1 Tax=Hyphomicrobium sp. TaxID=82 RepID=UPI0025BF5BB1|nr:tRNA lysidine(34) synthetase TilS [Hyphomicrobium sp.]MCC7253216.1 tRNA lysidine(34) synthetase TilS [Hyphomicrobium sp.]
MVQGEPAVHDQDPEASFGALLAPFKHAVLAVSGGSDSMALMVLAARWVASGQAPAGLTIEVATVDHGLRASSAREAEWVAERAKALGFKHTTLVWGGNKPGSALQARAREARYALLVAHARVARPSAVVTAHTADDQAETLIMRLGRGSGLDGLAGMAPSRPLLPDGSVQLVRPLLGLSKAVLVATLKETGGTWLDDPSNERLDFERVRLRAAHDHLSALGLSNDKLALSAARLTRARDALERLTQARLAALVDDHGGAFASLDRAAWEAEPEDVRVRLVARLLGAFGGQAKPAQLSQVEALVAVLARGRPVAQTLGGCIVSQGRTTLRLYREPGHHTLREVSLRPGEEVVWDWRFRVGYDVSEINDAEQEPDDKAEDQAAPAEVVVRPLGLAAYATLRGGLALKDRPPARAAAGLPSIWSGARLIAVPSLPGATPNDGRFRAEFLGLKRELR